MLGAGGYGFGRGSAAGEDGGASPDEGGGGGGFVEAAPIGYIEISPEGTHFQAIPDPLGTVRALRAGATALTALAAAVAAVREVRRRGDADTLGRRCRRSVRR